MAGRRATRGDVGCLAFVLLAALLAVLGPFALACWCVFAELRALAHRGAASVHDVLTDQEKSDLHAAERRMQALDAQYDQMLQRGFASGFVQRADGMFDARQPQARSLNTLLEQLQTQRDQAMRTYDEVMGRLGKRMNAWLTAKAGLIGARAALVTFVACFVGFVAMAGGRLDLFSLMFGSDTEGGARLGASFGAMLVAIGVLVVVQSAMKKSLAS